MSSWSESAARPGQRSAVHRGAVLRGSDAAHARPARMDAELRTSPFAPVHLVDPRLTDPHLQEVVATARRQAVEQGVAEGHRTGYAAGMAVAVAEAHVAAEQAAQVAAANEARRDAQLREAIVLLSTAAEAFRQREVTALAEIEGVVTDLALRIARAVLDRELVVSDTPGREAVTRALALAPPDCPATVRLHPDDAACLGELETLALGRHLVLVTDPTIEPGGCVVDAAGRQVDAQVGSALKRVADVLQGPLR
jgi:flagellar assembly protein FliH